MNRRKFLKGLVVLAVAPAVVVGALKTPESRITIRKDSACGPTHIGATECESMAKKRGLIDPMAEYVAATARNINRKKDNIIIAAIRG